MPDVFINGRFLSQPVSGVQRFAAEIVEAIDQLIDRQQLPERLRGANWTLLVPPNAEDRLSLKHVRVAKIGKRTGHAWDQIDLAMAARSGILVSLANSGPVLHRRHHIVLHDAQVFRHPEFFSRSYGWFHRCLGWLYARTARIITVSYFSRRELSDVLNIPVDDISVCSNSAEHLARIPPDDAVLRRLNLVPGRYFLAVGSNKRNKNIELVARAIKSLPRDYPLVIVGGVNERVFGRNDATADDRVIPTGHISDASITALYSHATALIFPSLYEGFGVPPLEAMVFGCPVIVSDIAVLREVCGDAAEYCSSTDPEHLARLMRERIEKGALSEAELARQLAQRSRYTWISSAQALVDSL
ncbi:glycosyltransferase family 1 protein [Bradyrhizobium sp. CCBAU 53340]|uniref:glycosyltransferase family 4 protein n=1 Tax=Bradyrhizobium sp. CCBAU 53340 TaxID=1325112 RepID=UPI00188BBB3E|nr:glycosyltransferase family 1 protein [Bradyrhizobium sp. CCBAU 53340]QOZ47339.1 glycosyltransferase family 1 protein [Bradyrhizobium sp. CCBAU 53340]